MIDVIMISAALVIVAVLGVWGVIDYSKAKKEMRDEEEKESKDNQKE